ncbi:MAG TPA: aldehyde dehydrogenase family protein [Nocardioidaceae bacterium]|nr:aldehyde dehydrogenase family protein [Nocardioidaceae bacterium]
MTLTHAFIGGTSVAAAQTYDNIDPSTGQVIGPVSRGGGPEVDRAVDAAQGAQPGWASHRPEDRARVLTRLAALILRDQERLSRVESEDTGKPLTQARTDTVVCARYFEFYGHAIDSYYGHAMPLDETLHVYTRKEPFGVVGHILAWNYPLQLLARAAAPAVATGNAVVVKPADETPRTAVMVAELAVEAGLPAGVLNVVTGIGAEAGDALANHPGVAHLGFVGSAEVGASIARAAADRLVPAVLELGGKSAQVVFPDADLETAAGFVVKAILQNAGQTCSAGSRLLAHDSIHDELLAMVAERFEATSIGPGTADKDLGPLISAKQQRRVEELVATPHGGQVVSGGKTPELEGLSAGCYFAPTLIAGADPTSRIAREEVFGPVLVANRFSTEQEAVELSNSTDYALLGAVWTSDVGRAHRLAGQIQAGQVFVNTYGAGGGVELPFGGFKRSGYGREKGYEALDNYTQTKTVIVRL